MSEIDMSKMVEMARERSGWTAYTHVNDNGEERRVVYRDANGKQYGRAVTGWGQVTQPIKDGDFIAQAPATILALHQQVQDLQAKVEQLEEEKRRLQIFLDEANDFMVNDSNQAKMLDQLKEQTQLLKGIKIT
jgi:predicted RNase H-like nuclease (RuvC/YqgF family)